MGQHIPLNDEDLGFLNNFFCHFRFGESQVMPDGLYRTVRASYWHIVQREYMKSEAKMYGGNLAEYFSSRSDKALDQTPAEFYNEVDRTTIEVGCNVEVIMEMILDFQKPNNTREQTFEKFDALEKYIRPIYTALRQKGYNRSDLWC